MVDWNPSIVIHLIAPFHTIVSEKFSHCAFTGKVLRFPRMIRLCSSDIKVIEYSNGQSESEAHEHVSILDADVVDNYKEHEFYGDKAVIGSDIWKLFDEKLRVELQRRVKQTDHTKNIIAYPFGNTHSSLISMFPSCAHIETGIGYPVASFNFRIYESSAWLHYHYAKDNLDPNHYHIVIPNYYDTRQWYYNPNPSKKYILFFGRICAVKGIRIVFEMAKRLPHEDFLIVGQGDVEMHKKMALEEYGIHNVTFKPPVSGKDRYDVVSNASCVVCATHFIEPFCGTHVESMLCGVPVISSNRGVFYETIEEGVNGYICRTLADYVAAVGACKTLDRQRIAEIAKKYSLESCGKKYVSYFRDVCNIYKPEANGWYAKESNHPLLSDESLSHHLDSMQL